MIVLCYGAGTNTTAMIVGLAARNITPDLIVMADTGAERPHTYAHIELMQELDTPKFNDEFTGMKHL